MSDLRPFTKAAAGEARPFVLALVSALMHEPKTSRIARVLSDLCAGLAAIDSLEHIDGCACFRCRP